MKLSKEDYDKLSKEDKQYFVNRPEATDAIQASYKVLFNKCDDGEIDYYYTDEVGENKRHDRRFNIKKYKTKTDKNKYIYARINKNGPKSDIDQQIKDLKCDDSYRKITDIQSIEDIASGKGKILELLKDALTGKISELIVAHKNILGTTYDTIINALKDYSQASLINQNLQNWSIDKIYTEAGVQVNINIDNMINVQQNNIQQTNIQQQNNILQADDNSQYKTYRPFVFDWNTIVSVQGTKENKYLPEKMTIAQAKKINRKYLEATLPDIFDDFAAESNTQWESRYRYCTNALTGKMKPPKEKQIRLKAWMDAQKIRYHSCRLGEYQESKLSDLPKWEWYDLEVFPVAELEDDDNAF